MSTSGSRLQAWLNSVEEEFSIINWHDRPPSSSMQDINVCKWSEFIIPATGWSSSSDNDVREINQRHEPFSQRALNQIMVLNNFPAKTNALLN